ncbi:MAG: 3-deoxy-8-phosphooctulonate synthase [Elusimicrobia bacterium RIFCSPLOWO2_01_FULL_54_10]|nr:MAG: 3-deoxy-8-phosphooctulonate synthase [Elusimicrobia bacterium RIFCSPLOWO2_01_FULL_54_10]
MKQVSVGTFNLGNSLPLALIAGPCVMESESHLRLVAKTLKSISKELGVRLIFKCSYDKANRSSVASYRGPGVSDGLSMLSDVKEEFNLTVLTDVHEPSDAAAAARVADVLQIPAFLCRQTDLLLACADTGRAVNVKKGQFLAPWEMGNVAEKISRHGNSKIIFTERGTSFGYNNLVVDMRGLEIMKRTGYPVVFDATHSVQLPGAKGKSSGGQREFVEPLARAAAAVGVAAMFMEVHPNPDRALSDGPNSVKLSQVKGLVKTLMAIDKVAKNGGRAQ